MARPSPEEFDLSEYERAEALARRIAEQQVDHFCTVILPRYGIKPEELPELIENLRWMNRYRKLLSTLATGTLLAIVVAVTGALLKMLWDGFTHSVNGPLP